MIGRWFLPMDGTNRGDPMTRARSEEARPTNPLAAAGERSARVNRTSDGDPIGASIFLTAQDLEALGVNAVRLDEFTYLIQEGELQLVGRIRGDTDHVVGPEEPVPSASE